MTPTVTPPRPIPWYRSLRFRLMAAAVTIEAVMLSLLLFNSFSLLNQAGESQTQARLEALTPLLDGALAGRVFERDHAEVEAIINRLTSSERSEIRYIAVYDVFGTLIATAGAIPPTGLPHEDQTIAQALTDLTYDARQPLTILNTQVGRVSFGLSLASMVHTQDRVVQEGICIAVLEILLSLILLATGGYLLTRHIHALINGTRRVAQGDYSTTIDIPGHDEIAMLAADFNTMATAIAGNISALKTSEMRFATIFNTVGEAIFVHDAATGKILDVNQRMCEMYGYSHEEALACGVSSAATETPPYTQNGARTRLQAAAAGTPQVFDWLARAKDGRLFWVEVSLRAAIIGNDDFVIAVVRDISERKAAEEALAAEKERLAVTLRSIGDGVITTDTRGRIILVNTVAEAMTGWSQQEAQGRPLTDVFVIIHEHSRLHCDNPVEKVLASGKITELANHTILIARDGSERKIADSGAPILDRKDQILGVVLVFRDVTERHRLEENLLKVKKLESVGVLAGGIAHDFNNILVAILGNINLAMLQSDIGGETRQLLLEAEKASIRARALTQQLLTFSKGGEPVRQTSPIGEIIRDSAEFILHGSNVACHYDIPEDLQLVDIDKGQMSQVIQNIILNAKHAMPDGGEIQITCRNITNPDPDDNAIRIDISDNGTGIPAHLLERIFDPYFTTKEEGSGLGLAITHSIISRHNGQISVQSEPGVKTTFTLHLTASNQLPTRENTPALTASAGRRCVMIMDDDEMVRNVTGSMLTVLGHQVVPARNGEEAVELYRSHQAAGRPIDLIIMDLTIPGGMGGRGAIKEILAINPGAKVVVSSGYSNDPVMAHYQEHGFAAALSKPFQMQELADTINDLLQE